MQKMYTFCTFYKKNICKTPKCKRCIIFALSSTLNICNGSHMLYVLMLVGTLT